MGNSVPQSDVSMRPVKIFISYSRKDKRYLEELRTYLKFHENNNEIEVWHDGNLTPGDDWETAIHERFCSAQVILLLISADFFASDYCWRRELPAAIQRHKDGNATVVPVIIRPCEWQKAAPAKLMVLPKNSVAVKEWRDRDQAYKNITKDLCDYLDQKYGALDCTTGSDDLWSNRDTRIVRALDTATDIPVLEAPTTKKVDSAADPGVGRVMTVTAVEPRSALPEVVVCFLHAERQYKLQYLRKWCHAPNDPLFEGQAAQVVQMVSLREAVERARARPETTILLLDGFEPSCPQLDEFAIASATNRPFNLIVNAPEWKPDVTHGASASMLGPVHAVSSDETLLATLRKSLLSIRARTHAEARVLHTKDEFAAYFELRYNVWSELGYLAPFKICAQTPWELDYTDRSSLPVGVFSRKNGELIAAARLVRAFGEDNRKYIQLIDEMLRERQSKTLIQNFVYPNSVSHPFDILGELDQFKDYYRNLVRRGISKAEVSRVVVSGKCRKQGLGEVVVDTICDLARSQAIQVLFLACRAEHFDFYQRCGFHSVRGVTGPRFLTYPVDCIAMDRQLSEVDEPANSLCRQF